MIDNYYTDEIGVVHQINKLPFVYDEQYVKDRYVKYGDLCKTMGDIRLSFLLGAIKKKPKSILDIGYGNGAFLDICNNFGIFTYGYDISGYEISQKHRVFLAYRDIFIDHHFTVVSMFDSMEHMENPDEILKNIDTEYIIVSVPWYKPWMGDDWFISWKHKRDNEHLHHYSKDSLELFFDKYFYKLISYSHIEDLVRYDKNNDPNILTAVFQREK